MNTSWGERFRLQVTLPNERVVNVRIHACEHCNFVEWAEAAGEKVADVTLSDDFIAKLTSAVTGGQNRCLAELVPEGAAALGQYAEAKKS